ncbi:MAG: hypothetical protein ACFCBU_04335 [Cyanophyceae cyanobacterium]
MENELLGVAAGDNEEAAANEGVSDGATELIATIAVQRTGITNLAPVLR